MAIKESCSFHALAEQSSTAPKRHQEKMRKQLGMYTLEASPRAPEVQVPSLSDFQRHRSIRRQGSQRTDPEENCRRLALTPRSQADGPSMGLDVFRQELVEHQALILKKFDDKIASLRQLLLQDTLMSSEESLPEMTMEEKLQRSTIMSVPASAWVAPSVEVPTRSTNASMPGAMETQ
eukprot:g7034.t1